MRDITMIGLDLAKNVIHLHAVDEDGRKVLARKLRRDSVLPFFASLPPCIVAMEACSGANYWSREIVRLGHEAKQISPQLVKPFVKTNKNDALDAEAICEAASRPSMRFVPIKTPEQSDIQALHRIRKGCIRRRTALASQARGFAAEHGVVVPKGLGKLRERLPLLVEDMSAPLTFMARDYLSDIYTEIILLDERVAKYDRQLMEIATSDSNCKRLMKIPGIGPILATIIVAAASDGSCFKNGRHFAAWLGLVPRQHSTGGRSRLFGISKRGDSYIRSLLIQGAHNLVRRPSPWLAGVIERRGRLKACVAQANKTARIAWAVLTKGEEYKAA